jgi:hypothetical protein
VIGQYDFTIGADDGQGGHAEQSFHLAVSGPAIAPNTITALSSTPTGFRARFDHAFDPAGINLYQADDAPELGMADVRLMMTGGAAVPGTLILDDDNAGFSFVKTGSSLANGGYTVTLKSGSAAFNELDGNGEGTAGDDYAGAIDINNGATLARVGINDAARGPGQAVDGALSVTLTSNPGANVISVKFNVQYDPALLTLTGADLAVGLPAGSKVVASFATPGLARFTVSSPTAMGAGTIKLVNLKGTVPANAPYGAKQILDVIDVAINSTQAGLDDDAVHVVAYIGDASGNAQYTTLDVSRIERVANGLDSGFSAYRNVDPRLVADVNGSGAVNPADRDILNDELNGIDRPEIPAIPSGMDPIQFSGPDPLVAVPDLTAQAGATLIVPVYLDTAQDLESVQLTLGYDPQALQVLAVRPGSLTGSFPYFIERHDAGTVYVDMSGPRLAGGAGSLIELEVRVKETASGPIAIDFRSAALNEGHLTIGQLPQLGSDPTDGLIVVATADAATLSSNSGSVSTFFETFKEKIGILVQRIGQFFESDAETKPVLPLSRVSQSKSVAAAQAPAIDLTRRLASFTVTGNDAVTGQLNDGQRWKRDLAGGAEPAADPNSKLRVPVSVAASGNVTSL